MAARGPRIVSAVLVLALAAAVPRFVALGRAPLDPIEASQAIAAHWAMSGSAESIARLDPRPESGLLLGAQAPLFWMIGEGDARARVLPALAGLALALLPLVLTARGRGGLAATPAFALAILLAIDPRLVASSRRADGAILAVAAAVASHLILLRLTAVAPGAAHRVLAHRLWMAWAAAAGLLVASGPVAWDFLPAVGGAALLASVRRAPAGAVAFPARGGLLPAAGGAAIVAATSGLVQWRGPALVSVSLESWLAGWSAAAPGAGGELAGAVGRSWESYLGVAYGSALGGLALWGLLRLWRPAVPARAGADRFEAEVLSLWLLWGALSQLRPGGGPETRLALVVPLLLAAGHGLSRAFTAAGRWNRPPRARLAAVLASALAGVVALSSVERWAVRAETTLPSVRRLARDVAAFVELPADRRPEIELETGARVDAVLAWYLRDVEVRWTGVAAAAGDEVPALALRTRLLAAEEIEAGDPAYAVRREGDALRIVELR